MSRPIERPAVVGLLILLFLGIAGYALFQTRGLLEGPGLSISTPKDGDVATSPLITVEGRALNSVSLRINDAPVSVNEEGVFQEQLLLPSGYTILKIEAKDRFGKSIQKEIRVAYVASSTIRE